MPFIDNRGIFGPAGKSYSDSRYNDQNDYNTWTDPTVINVDNGVNSATGLPFTRGDAGFGDYTARADANGRAEAARQAAASGGGGLFGLGDIGTLALLAGGGYLLGPAGAGLWGAEGAGALAAGDAMAGLIPAGELGAWAGATGTAGAAGSGAMDWNALTDGFGFGDAASGTTSGGFDLSSLYPDFTNYSGQMSQIPGLESSLTQTPLNLSAGAASSSGWLDTIKNYITSNPGSTANTLKSLLGSGDLSKVLGSLGAAGLGAYASNKQTNALEQQAQRYEGYGAPYRQKLSDLYKDPTSFLSSPEVRVPVDQGTSSLMRSLSTQGNPFGSGNALQQGQSYASDQLFGKLGQEKDRLAGFGGLSSYNQAAPQASTNAINSGANTWNAVGAGANNIFNPPQTPAQQAAEWMKAMGK